MAAWLLLSCGGEEQEPLAPGDPDPPVPASISITPATVRLSAFGDTVRLRAEVRDQSGRILSNVTLAWASSEPAVATVDATGLVTAVANGVATISARAGAASATVPVEVAVRSASTVVVPEALQLYGIGENALIDVTVLDQNGDTIPDAPVAWSSGDPAVVTVDHAGTVTAVSRGRALVTARSGEAQGNVLVRVTPSSLFVTPSDLSIERPLRRHRLTAELRDDVTDEIYGPPDSVSWVSLDTMIAVVAPNGIVTGLRKGMVRVVATAGSRTAEAGVRVADPERDALVEFYHATGGDDWVRKDNWLTDQPIWQPPGWYGVLPIGAAASTAGAGAEDGAGDLGALIRSITDTASVIDSTTADGIRTILKAEWEAWSRSDPAIPDWTESGDPGESLAPGAGRVFSIMLEKNHLTGAIDDLDVWEELAFLKMLDLNANALTGGVPALSHLQFLVLSHNAFSGPIPPALLDDGQFLLLSLRGNELTGEIPTAALGGLLFLLMEGNDLTGTLRLPELAPGLLLASWFDNMGLCQESGVALDRWLQGRFVILEGPLCDAMPGGPAVAIRIEPAFVDFVALGDTVEIELRAIDLHGWRTSVPDRLIWSGLDDEIATVTRFQPDRARVVPRANGNVEMQAHVDDPAHRAIIGTVLQVRVRQVPVMVDEDDITLPLGATATVVPIPRDRNGYETPLPRGTATSSTDTDVAVLYRNHLLRAVGEGTARLETTLPGGVSGATTVTVTGPAEVPVPEIATVSPSPLVAGVTATITGRNLGTHVEVLIDGHSATVVSADSGTLTVTVPTFGGCTPNRNVAVVVRGSEGVSDVFITRLHGTGVDMSAIPVGVLYGPVQFADNGELCLQAAEGEGTQYVLGIQALYADNAEAPEDVTPFAGDFVWGQFDVALSASADDGAAADRVPATSPLAPSAAASTPPSDDWLSRHRDAERRIRTAERETFRSLPRTPVLGAARGPARDWSVGDTIDLVHNLGRCREGAEIEGLVRVVGESVVIISDLANANDYSDEQYATLGRIADETIMPALSGQFGPPPDVDGDGRVAMVFTDEITRTFRGLLGWVAATNLLPKAICPASNEMEVFFGVTPDPEDVAGGFSPQLLSRILPPLIAHETTHIIQGRRFLDSEYEGFMETWLAEGMAVLGEEISGHAAGGHEPGMNYSSDLALSADENGIVWYASMFHDFSTYFLSGGEAPSSCSWWSDHQMDDCKGRPLWYGVSWSFLRWVSDHYGSRYPGGETALHTDIVNATPGPPGREFRHISRLVGEDFGVLLTGWAAALWLDDRLPETTPPQPFQFPSWNLRDIFAAKNIRIPTVLLRFADEEFGNALISTGSTLYTWLRSAGPGPATAFRFDGDLFASDAPDLPDLFKLQGWVVRLEESTAR